MGDERAEVYLRLLGEVELRRAGDQLRGLDAAGGPSYPGMTPFAVADSALWKVGRAGRILAAVGAVDEDFLERLASELHAAMTARSRGLLETNRGGGGHTVFASSGCYGQVTPGRAGREVLVTPVGRALRVADDRAPATLHLMSLVRTGTEALVTVVMRMHWPPDGSSTDLEIMGAGPHHLPFGQLWAVDEEGTRYAVQFDRGMGGTAAWRGIARLSPAPPDGARWLELVGDGTRLVRLPVVRPAVRRPAAAVVERTATEPGERMLILAAESILASGDARVPVEGAGIGGADPGEIVTVLTEAGVIAAANPLPGQFAALCLRLGATGQTITVPAAAEIPEPWASVIGAQVPQDGAEVFVPLVDVLPDVDGARFALAGLSTAGGETYLHVVSSGMAEVAQRADRFVPSWKTGFSWWLRDGEGNWHVGTAGEAGMFGDGTQEFLVRLTPPVVTVPEAAEVVVTGPATRVRATVTIRPAISLAAGRAIRVSSDADSRIAEWLRRSGGPCHSMTLASWTRRWRFSTSIANLC